MSFCHKAENVKEFIEFSSPNLDLREESMLFYVFDLDLQENMVFLGRDIYIFFLLYINFAGSLSFCLELLSFFLEF